MQQQATIVYWHTKRWLCNTARKHKGRECRVIFEYYSLRHLVISCGSHCVHNKTKITDWPNKTVACTQECNMRLKHQRKPVWMYKRKRLVHMFETPFRLLTSIGKRIQNDPSSPLQLVEIKCGAFLKSSQDPSWPHLQVLFWKETLGIRWVTKAFQPPHQHLKLAALIWPCGHNSHHKAVLAPLPRDISNPKANKLTPQDNQGFTEPNAACIAWYVNNRLLCLLACNVELGLKFLPFLTLTSRYIYDALSCIYDALTCSFAQIRRLMLWNKQLTNSATLLYPQLCLANNAATDKPCSISYSCIRLIQPGSYLTLKISCKQPPLKREKKQFHAKFANCTWLIHKVVTTTRDMIRNI